MHGGESEHFAKKKNLSSGFGIPKIKDGSDFGWIPAILTQLSQSKNTRDHEQNDDTRTHTEGTHTRPCHTSRSPITGWLAFLGEQEGLVTYSEI